jgi:hypothetical protein
MISLSNPAEVPTVTYEYLFCHHRVSVSGHPLNGWLEGY